MAAARSGLLLLTLLSPCYCFQALPRPLRLFGGEPASTNDVNILRAPPGHPNQQPNLLRASAATPPVGLAKAEPAPPSSSSSSPLPPTSRQAAAWPQTRSGLANTRRRRRRRAAAATALRAAAAGGQDGEQQEPASAGGGGGSADDATESGDGGEMSPGSSVGDGGTSGSRGRGNDGDDGGGGGGGGRRGAESMELRDFRARLMSKGLDGWGAEGEEAGRGEESGAGKGKARGLDGAATSERWAHPLVHPELGCLVIAKEDMFTQQQQYFYKAVALVIQHGDDGTVALILNRPTTFTMGDVCTGDLLRVPGMEDNVLYMGGDVAGARDDGLDVVNLMHGREDVPALEVVKGLRLGGLKEALALVAKGEADPEEFKFFSRYSGWGPGQLEAEVLAGAWELAACDLESVLQSHNHPDQPGHFWTEIMSRLRRHRGSGSSSTAAIPDT